jgi:hypothetical protein
MNHLKKQHLLESEIISSKSFSKPISRISLLISHRPLKDFKKVIKYSYLREITDRMF